MIWFLRKDPLDSANLFLEGCKSKNDIRIVMQTYLGYLLDVAKNPTKKSKNPYIVWLQKGDKNFEYLMFLCWYLLPSIKNPKSKEIYTEVLELWIYGPQYLPLLPKLSLKTKPPKLDKTLKNSYKGYRLSFKKLTT